MLVTTDGTGFEPTASLESSPADFRVRVGSLAHSELASSLPELLHAHINIHMCTVQKQMEWSGTPGVEN